jgi:hypothetical protein
MDVIVPYVQIALLVETVLAERLNLEVMATLYDYYNDGNNNNSVLIYMQIQQPKGQRFIEVEDSVHGIFCNKNLSTFL